jgi:hypothetical protein
MVRDASLLTIGDWRKTRLSTIMENAQQLQVLHWLRGPGLLALKEQVMSRLPQLRLRTSYAGMCDFCAALMYTPQSAAVLAQIQPPGPAQDRQVESVGAKPDGK